MPTLYRIFVILVLAALAAGRVECGQGPQSGSHPGLSAIHEALESGELTPAQAVRRYRVFLRRHRDQPDAAAEAYFEIGLLSEEMGRMDDAFRAYLSVLEHPDTVFFLPAADALYKMGPGMLEDAAGKSPGRYRLAGKGFEALAGVYDDEARSAELRYMVGLCSMGRGDYAAAREDFLNVVENFRVEPWREKAFYGLGLAMSRMLTPANRDPTNLERAIKVLEDFLREYPDGEHAPPAAEKLDALVDIHAEYLFGICVFYLRRGDEGPAGFYYRILSELYPGSRWTETAAERLGI